MKFNSLKEKYLYYRNITDYKLYPNGYVMVMLDGRSFSKKIKKKFERPFDKKFIDIMNQTAVYLCENVSNCKFAYVQSDEISLVLSDFGDAEPFFWESFMQTTVCNRINGNIKV
jgi:tRNA(His) guanylyltransferase